jgi:alpha-glucosidase
VGQATTSWRSRALAFTSTMALALTGLMVTTPPTASAATGEVGAVTGFSADGDTYTFRSGDAALRIAFEDDDLFRVQLAPDGTFTDPANDDPADPDAPDADIVVKRDYPGADTSYVETPDAYAIRTDEATLTVTKVPLTLHLASAAGVPLWDETTPLSWTDQGTTQTLEQRPQEQFFGGGMQNGRFSHRGETIDIARDYNWNDGGNPNAAPFYLSSRGYGVLRNTFAPGSYDFDAPVRTTHEEQRFDAYYFVGGTKDVIDGYTELTGRPAMLPMSALEIGDADCYLHNANRGERETLRDSTAIADGYREHGLPLGWMLVNDGYGCEYEDLPETGDMLHEHGAELGLWTQRDLTNQEYEVESGVRVRKTDVAWVGPGYRFALDACEKARDGIEDNSTDRATVLTVEGWAGTQRCAAMWSGDQSGSWEYIRWQIPTYAGSTMSGQHVTTGDVDGIFGGSAKTYARDLQWKMFLPMTYAMSGWAASDKQPWRYGAPYTGINRKYLQLHERLLPYFYTHIADANRTGLGPTRPLYVDYPDDPNTWGDAVKYEFMAGDDFLVAPVYEDSSVRDGIYLPKGRWVDYWTGRVYDGQRTVDGYKAPLDTLPLFVRAGAVVPMFPEGTLDWAEGKRADQLDLDVYPQGTSDFTLYEDDGHSQAYAAGASATQRFDVTAPEQGRGPVEVRIGSLDGSYPGQTPSRHYRLTVHTDAEPDTITVDGLALSRLDSAQSVNDADSGFAYDPTSGVIHVKTAPLPTGRAATVRITGAGAVGGSHPQERQVSLDAQAPSIAVAGEPADVTATVTNSTGKPIDVTAVRLEAPAGWTVAPSGPTSRDSVQDRATFTAKFRVTPRADAEPGTHELTATADYQARDLVRSVIDRTSTTVAFGTLSDAFNNVGVTASDDPTPGDIDGGGSSFLAERLAEQGLTPGADVALNGFAFHWPDSTPGTPDNVGSNGETIRVSGQGNALAFLGTGTSGSAGGTATVHYADGSTVTGTLGFPNWCCLPTDSYGAKIAVRTLGKNTPSGPAYPTVEYRLYTKTLRIDPDKQLAAVTLPGNSAVHVFAMAAGNEEVVPPPIADGQYQLTNAGSGQALEAPGSDSSQLVTASPSSSALQKWVLTRHDVDGSYQVKNAESGQCMDVFSSSRTEGALVGQYTCTGTSNQRWKVSVTDGALTLTAQHSGLVLAAGSDGKVVQQSDTGDPAQRWGAAAG